MASEENGLLPLRAAISRAAEQVPELEQAISLGKQLSQPREMQVSPETAKALFGDPVGLTASRMDKLARPLDFFLYYGLKARLRKELPLMRRNLAPSSISSLKKPSRSCWSGRLPAPGRRAWRWHPTWGRYGGKAFPAGTDQPTALSSDPEPEGGGAFGGGDLQRAYHHGIYARGLRGRHRRQAGPSAPDGAGAGAGAVSAALWIGRISGTAPTETIFGS